MIQKPDWFDNFLATYYEPVDFHITLTQPRYISSTDMEQVQAKIQTVIDNLGKKSFLYDTIVFNKLIIDKEHDDTYTFMLNIEPSWYVTELQKEIYKALSEFDRYVDVTTKDYESNFYPHITIAVNLNEQEKIKAEDVTKQIENPNHICTGKIEDLVVVIVNNTSIEERTNPNNKFSFPITPNKLKL